MKFQSLWQMPLLLGVAATSFTYASTAPAAAIAAPTVATAAPTGPVDTATLMKQIDDLKKQVALVAHKQRKAEEKMEAVTKVEDAKIGVLQANQISAYPEGYIAISSNTAISFDGSRIKGDMAYYPGNNGEVAGDILTIKALPIKGIDSRAGKSGHFNGTAQGSRLQFNTLTHTNSGDVKSQIQTDFYGANGSAAASSSTSTSYGIRIRQAHVSFSNLLAGQTDSNFHDADLMGTALDNSGGLAPVARRPQIRWTQKSSDGLNLSVSAEKGNTDYVTGAGGFKDNSTFGKSPLPDFTARLRYEGQMGFVSLRGIMRTLQVNVAKGETDNGVTSTTTGAIASYSSKQTGWGLGVSGKLITTGKSNLHGQVNFGDGLGYLVDDASNQAGYLQVKYSDDDTGNFKNRFATRFDTQTVTNAALGYEHWWTEAFRTNLAYSYTKIKNSKFAPVLNGTTQINARVKKVLVNAIYSVNKNIDFGVEMLHGIRETIGGYDNAMTGTTYYTYAGGTGKATQIMTSFIYKF